MKNLAPSTRNILQPILCMSAATVVLIAWSQPAAAQRFATGGPYGTPAGKSPTAALLRDVAIEQHQGAPLPLDAVFRDEEGREVSSPLL